MTTPGVSCKAVATQNSSEWPCSMCPFPQRRLVGVRASYIYFSNISWTPWVPDPIINPHLGPPSWLHPVSLLQWILLHGVNTSLQLVCYGHGQFLPASLRVNFTNRNDNSNQGSDTRGGHTQSAQGTFLEPLAQVIKRLYQWFPQDTYWTRPPSPVN